MTSLKTNATAGAPTPSGRQKSSAFLNAHADDTHFAVCGTAQIDLDDRLDDLIAIADLTGATLDAVVATVGRLPEATFTAVIDVLSTLCAPPSPTALPDLLHQHRALSDEIGRAVKDSAITDDEIQLLDRKLEEIEARIMATPARSVAEAYSKLLTVFPELRCDLEAPVNAPLRAEIEATIGGEVA